MKRRNFVGLALATSLLVTTFTGCGQQEATTGGNTPTAAPEKKVLKLITSPDYPPYEYYDTSGGDKKIIGFDIDIAKKITETLGYKLEIVESDFNGIIPAITTNRADFAMAGMTPTPERKQSVDFSQIYYVAENTVISKKGSNITKVEDLAGKKVGVQLGTTQEKEAQAIAEKQKGMTIASLNKVGDIIQEVKSGRIDAAIIEDVVAEGYQQQNTDLEFYTIPTEGESGSAIAFPKGSPLVAEFDKEITKLKESGEIKKLVQEWFSKEQTK